MDSFVKHIPNLPCRVIVNDVTDYTSHETTSQLTALIEAGFSYTGVVQLDDDPVDHPQLSIVILGDFVEAIPREQAEAILYHEVGHVVLGHADNLPAIGVLKDLKCELTADAYAAVKVSPQAMYDAIVSVVSFKVHILAGLVPEVHIKEEIKRKLACPIVVARLNALKAMFDV